MKQPTHNTPIDTIKHNDLVWIKTKGTHRFFQILNNTESNITQYHLHSI